MKCFVEVDEVLLVEVDEVLLVEVDEVLLVEVDEVLLVQVPQCTCVFCMIIQHLYYRKLLNSHLMEPCRPSHLSMMPRVT